MLSHMLAVVSFGPTRGPSRSLPRLRKRNDGDVAGVEVVFRTG